MQQSYNVFIRILHWFFLFSQAPLSLWRPWVSLASDLLWLFVATVLVDWSQPLSSVDVPEGVSPESDQLFWNTFFIKFGVSQIFHHDICFYTFLSNVASQQSSSNPQKNTTPMTPLSSFEIFFLTTTINIQNLNLIDSIFTHISYYSHASQFERASDFVRPSAPIHILRLCVFAATLLMVLVQLGNIGWRTVAPLLATLCPHSTGCFVKNIVHLLSVFVHTTRLQANSFCWRSWRWLFVFFCWVPLLFLWTRSTNWHTPKSSESGRIFSSGLIFY